MEKLIFPLFHSSAMGLLPWVSAHAFIESLSSGLSGRELFCSRPVLLCALSCGSHLHSFQLQT